MARKGERYKYGECGVVMVIEDPCSCASCDLICCDVQMKEVKTKVEAKTKAKSNKSKVKNIISNSTFFLL